MPFGFTLDAAGLWFSDPGKDEPPTWIAAPLVVKALARDTDGEAWGRLIEFADPDGRSHEWCCPAAMLAGDGAEFRSVLLSQGLDLAPGQRARGLLARYVLQSRPEARAICTDRTGWHGHKAFVLPDRVLGEADTILFQHTGESFSLHNAGNLEGWRDGLAALCVGNPRLTFAVSAAFAATLLEIVGDAGGGLHFVGASSTGKSTALRAAASVWESPARLSTWRATTNGLEASAALHNDRLLILDELGEIDPREAGAAAYMLANGSGKSRARRDGLARRAASWRLLFLSSGEMSLADHMREGGRRTRAGQELRIADLPTDGRFGLFDNLHSCSNGAAFAGRVMDAATRDHGHAGPAFVEQLMRIDRDTLRTRIATLRADFAADMLPADADGQSRRIVDRFALVAAGGLLAANFGIVSWPKEEAMSAAKVCFHSWLERRGGGGQQEDMAALAAVDHFIEAHGASRFQRMDSEERTYDRAGFLRIDNGRRQFLFLPNVFKQEVCLGLDHRQVLRILQRAGRLQTEGLGHLTIKPRGLGRVYGIWESAE